MDVPTSKVHTTCFSTAYSTRRCESTKNAIFWLSWCPSPMEPLRKPKATRQGENSLSRWIMELELSMHNMTKDQEDILTQSFIPYFFKKKITLYSQSWNNYLKTQRSAFLPRRWNNHKKQHSPIKITSKWLCWNAEGVGDKMKVSQKQGLFKSKQVLMQLLLNKLISESGRAEVPFC